jgi:hypothetical protein
MELDLGGLMRGLDIVALGSYCSILTVYPDSSEV